MHSELLKAFHKAMAVWLKMGCPETNVFKFSRHTGLCENLINYLLAASTLDSFARAEVRDEMCAAFQIEHGSRHYPFNEDRYEYRREVRLETLYRNPGRLDWIKQHCT